MYAWFTRILHKLKHTQPTPQGFIEFVNKQPRLREMEHGRWTTCALGHYFHSIGSNLLTKGWHPKRVTQIVSTLSSIQLTPSMVKTVRDYSLTSTTLYDVLNKNYVASSLHLNTYGNLQDFIRDNCYIQDVTFR